MNEQQAIEQQAQEPTFTVNDLGTMIQIIDVVSERGAFKGPELEAVGILRGRLARFLQANTPPSAEEDQQPQPTEATE